MEFTTPLIFGKLIKRYKRFLADITLDDGSLITAHCPNTGTMLTCSTPGSPVALSISDNPKRKYLHTLEMIMVDDTWVGVNTAKTNGLVKEAIEKGFISEFRNVEKIKTEVKVSDHSRLDLQLFHGEDCTFVEIKNCSLAENRCAMFPDAVTTRGTKHLKELTQLVETGNKGCIFYLVQRLDADRFEPAKNIDPTYAQALIKAYESGVTVLVYQAGVTPKGIEVQRSLPFELYN